MNHQPLYDVVPIKLELVESNEPGKVIARGEFGRCDVPTANKRRYGRPIIESNLERLNESIGRRRLFGELDHPNDGKTLLQRVSHVITNLSIDKDGRVIGEAEILDTPQGTALKAILKAGCEVGVSSRGMGSVVLGKDGNEDVQEDYVLKTYDFVADPATRTAYPKFVQEALEEAEKAMAQPITFSGLPEDVKTALLEEAAKEAKASLSEDMERARTDALAEAAVAAKAEAASIVEDAKRRFAEELVSSIATVKQEALAEAKTEILSDPALGAARAILEQVVVAVRPLLAPPEETERSKVASDTIVAMRDALQEKDLQIANLKISLDEAEAKLVRTTISHELALRIDGHPKEAQIRKMLGPVDRLESIDDLRERLDAILDTVGTREKLVGESVSGPIADRDAKLAEADRTVAALRESLEKSAKSLEEAHAQLSAKSTNLQKAVDLGIRLDAQSFAAREVIGRPDALRLLKLTENCATREEVSGVLNKHPVSSLNENEETARVRARVRRGLERNLDEDAAPPQSRGDDMSKWLGLEPGEMERLAGVTTGVNS